MPPMPAMPQMPGPGQHQLPPGPPMGRMPFGDDPPSSRGSRSRMPRGGSNSQFGGSQYGGSQFGGSQYGNRRRDPYAPDGPDGDDGGMR